MTNSIWLLMLEIGAILGLQITELICLVFKNGKSEKKVEQKTKVVKKNVADSL